MFMKARATLVLTLAAASTPAAAQQLLDPTFPFTTTRTADSCTMASLPTPEAAAVVATTASLDRPGPTQVTGQGWGFVPDARYSIRVRARMDQTPYRREEQEQTVAALGYRDASGAQGLKFETTPLPMLHGDLIDLYREGEDRPFATVRSLWRGYRGWMALCLRDLMREDRGTGRPAVHAPAPRGPIDTYFTNDDYPAAALRAEEQGEVAVALTISARGRVSDCTIAASSGSAALDRATCALLNRRARFHPALDADALATQGIYRTTVTWRIPRNEP